MAPISKGNSTLLSGLATFWAISFGAMVRTTWRITFSRAVYFLSVTTQNQGAATLWVRVSISSRAAL